MAITNRLRNAPAWDGPDDSGDKTVIQGRRPRANDASRTALASDDRSERPTETLNPDAVLQALEDQLSAVFQALDRESRTRARARPQPDASLDAGSIQDLGHIRPDTRPGRHGHAPLSDIRPAGRDAISPKSTARGRGTLRHIAPPIASLAALLVSGAVAYSFMGKTSHDGVPQTIPVTKAVKDESRIAERLERLERSGDPAGQLPGHGHAESEPAPATAQTQAALPAPIDSAPGKTAPIGADADPRATDAPALASPDLSALAALPTHPVPSHTAHERRGDAAGFGEHQAPLVFQAARGGPHRQGDLAAPSDVAPSPRPDIAAAADDSLALPATEEAARAPATRGAQVITHVNMRAGPDNDAEVLTVVPAGRQVDLMACSHWCEVIFEGQQGWIYKSFIAGPDGREASGG